MNEIISGQLRVAFIGNVIPTYRRPFYKKIAEHPAVKLTVFCQDKIRGVRLKLAHDGLECAEIVSHAGTEIVFAWQWLPVKRLLQDFDVFVFYGNPRILSTLVWASVFRMLGKRVVIIGHGHTAGASRWSEWVRLRWWSLFRTILVYTDSEAKSLRSSQLRGRRVIGLNNGLDQSQISKAAAQWNDALLADWRARQGLKGGPVLLSSARLTAKNKFHLLLPAIAKVRHSFPDMVWCVVGDGELRGELSCQVKAYGLEGHVLWLGELYEEEKLAPWFLVADLFVHPGAIGLSLLHAFGYGLPVLTHDNPIKHMPEFAALRSGVNGIVFKEDDCESLAEALLSVLPNRASLKEMAIAARAVAEEEYNIDVMVTRFVAAVSESD